jgi:hypothetical protein
MTWTNLQGTDNILLAWIKPALENEIVDAE